MGTYSVNRKGTDADYLSLVVGPAIPLYFSFFYTKQEMGLRMAYWFGFAAVAGAFGGLVAFGVQHAHSHIADWRILFIIEVLRKSLISSKN